VTTGRTIAFYFDFISPYAWLALMAAERFAERQGIRWRMRPVVYAALLQADGAVGPAETPAKRRYTFRDIVRCARELELPFAGPPEHPFRSIEALRAMWLFRDDPAAPRLAAALADACWGQGKPLTSLAVIEETVRSVGLDTDGLAERMSTAATKRGLAETTDEAIAAGLFGVPTFVVDGELFWGHDRMPALARRLSGEPAPEVDVDALLDRPYGVRRRGAP